MPTTSRSLFRFRSCLVAPSALAAIVVAACSSTPDAQVTPQPAADAGAQADASDASDAATYPPTVDDDEATLPPIDMTGPIGGARPGLVVTPPNFDGATKTYPLVILLHGYGASDADENAYLQLSDEAGRQGYVTLLIDGLVDKAGKQYWNDTDACCDLFGAGTDDFGYIRDVIRQVQARYAIDKKRTYIFGHSNGAFMAHRLACLQSNRIAGIAALAGAMWNDTAKCSPTHPVAVLTIHGTSDATINYNGGVIKHSEPTATTVPYPGALTTIATWGARNGCSDVPVNDAPRDYESSLPGDEATPLRYQGCKEGGAAELWTLANGSHLPAFSDAFLPAVFAFWASHPRP